MNKIRKPGQGGFIAVGEVVIDLPPTKMELFELLLNAYEQDKDMPPEMRGWRSAKEIIPELFYPVEVESLRRAVSIINKKFKQASQRLGLDPLAVLIESKRGIGYRLKYLFDQE